MKRCPECRRDYYDDTLLYCLDDGNALLEGPASGSGVSDEPATAILTEFGVPPSGNPSSESPTRAQMNATDRTAILSTGAEAKPRKSLGELTEKRIFSARRAKPLAALVIAFLVLVGGFFGYRYFTPNKQIESIAVMPFVNESKNEDIEYLSDGMTETLISSLTNLPNLNVKARSTVFRYKGKETDAKTIGKELNVQAILTGRVTQRDDQLTLSLELVDAATENAIWSQQYSRKQSDLATLQADIARDISGKLKSRLSGAEAAKVEKNSKVNAEAYQLYLKGLFQYNRLTGNSLTQAAEYFKQSIEKDPNYAPAYVGLGKTLWSLPVWSLADPRETHPQLKAAALKALELDDSLPGAHDILGMYLRDAERDWVGAERELRRAIELDPNNIYAHESLGWLLAFQKRFDEAIAAGKRATELDPRSTRTPHIQILVWARRYDEAIAELKAVQILDPSYADTYWRFGTAYYGKGLYQESVTSFQKYLELDDEPVTRAFLALAKAKTGNRDEAVKQLNWLKQESSKRYISGTAFGITYLALGEKDEAYKWLDKDIDDRLGYSTWYGVLPALDELRDEPRFKAMLKRMGLPE